MSVLVKNMQMPSSCLKCPCVINLIACKACGGRFITNDGVSTDGKNINVKRPSWCPLVELPEHHGRLIDADKLMRVYEDRLEKVADRYGVDSSEAGILSGAMKLLMIELGIVEAE